MTQNSDGSVERTGVWTSPTMSVRTRVKELRQARGWTADDLALRCAELDMPSLNRSVIANLESGRRKYVTLDETMCLAYALDVAPIHLMVPIEERTDTTDGHSYMATPDRFLGIGQAREWVRGRYCPSGLDPRIYWSSVPREDWEPPRYTPEQIDERGELVEQYRDIGSWIGRAPQHNKRTARKTDQS